MLGVRKSVGEMIAMYRVWNDFLVDASVQSSPRRYKVAWMRTWMITGVLLWCFAAPEGAGKAAESKRRTVRSPEWRNDSSMLFEKTTNEPFSSLKLRYAGLSNGAY